eukprot:g12537.t1
MALWGLTQLGQKPNAGNDANGRRSVARDLSGRSGDRRWAVSWLGIVLILIGAQLVFAVMTRSDSRLYVVSAWIGGGLFALAGLYEIVRSFLPAVESGRPRNRQALSAQGGVFLAMMIVMFIGSLIGRSNMLMLVFSLMAGPFVAGGWMTYTMLKRMKVRRTIPRRMMAGDRIWVELTIENQKRSVSSWLMDVADEIRGNGEALNTGVLFARVPPRGSRSGRYELRLMQRGRYRFGPLTISTRFPLGFVERGVEFTQSDEILVYPRMGELLPAWKQERSTDTELVQSQRPQQNIYDDEFHRLREFRWGDNPRAIHWRTSARRNELMMREYQQTRQQDLTLLLDLWIPEKATDDDWERVELAISFAATVGVDHMRDSRDSIVSLRSAGRTHAEWKGQASSSSFDSFLETLAVVQPSVTPDTEPTTHQPKTQQPCRGNSATPAGDDDSPGNGTDETARFLRSRRLMRNLSGALQISMHILICLAILMLGYAERAVFPYFITLPIVMYSMFGTKRWPQLQLPTGVANVLGLVAFGLAAKGLFSANIESRLLAGAHLLIYLTWIVLLQAKKYTQYWWLFALAILQIAVGAILTSNGFFGFLLILFLFTAIWTLTVFSLHQAGKRFASDESLDLINQADAPAPKDANKPEAAPMRPGKLLLQPSLSAGSIEQDQQGGWFNMRFFCGIAGMTSAALAIGLTLFLFVPRRWIGKHAWASNVTKEAGGQTLVGFAESVQLGAMGQILESNERVMEVRMFDHDSGNEIDVERYSTRLGYDEPLFRGQVLDKYENGNWTRTRIRRREARDLTDDPERGMVRQEIRLAPIGTNVLFSMQPSPIRNVVAARIVDQSGHIRFRSIGSILLRNSTSNRKRIVYEVYTKKAAEAKLDTKFGRLTVDESSGGRYLQFPAARLPNLISEARRIAGVSESPRPDHRLWSKRLLSHLRDRGGFQYKLGVRREQFSVDPVEEFLQRKTGHCEYFASALALMLRAVGIPSRIVSGFKGGTKNKITGYYEIEQRHAHAWVEAMIDGHWEVLDATPVDERQQSVDGMEHRLRSWQDVVNFVSDLWNSYVVDINLGSQRKKLYDPVRTSATDIWTAMTDPKRGTSSKMQVLKEFLMNPKMWFSWKGGLIAFVLMLAASALVWGIKKLAGVLRRFEFQRKSVRNRHTMHVAFYERFRTLCAKMGMVRTPAQTQREFARAVAETLRTDVGRPDAAGPKVALPGDLPIELSETFYEVRFGAQPLSDQQADEIDRRLSEWERLMQSANGNSAK